MKVTQRTINIDGLPIHYAVAGQGEPIVFIHGLSGSWRWWRRNIPTLARHYQLYLLDLPGFGAMRRFAQHFQLQESATWLNKLLQALELHEIHLVGHSMGGYISIAYAALYPEKVKHLVLVDSIGIRFQTLLTEANIEQRLTRMALIAIGKTTPRFWPYIFYDYLRAGSAMVRNASRQIIALEAAEAIAAVNVPTLLIWGSHDDLVPLSLGRQLHQQLKGSHLLILQGSNHFPMFDQPHDFNTALLTFLQGQEIGILNPDSPDTPDDISVPITKSELGKLL
ncbi:MAG: alpha/beta hydrolase [Chloroflexi bacterium]|nr:alpha/beta hydrolase [Chloroflexota bacterium]